MKPLRRTLLKTAALTPFYTVARAASAWPAGVVTIILPYAAGGGTDLLARTLAERLTQALGQSFIVENRPGAAGNIGASLAAHDTSGYKLLFTTASIAVNQTLYKDLQYRLATDLQAVSMATSSPLILSVPANSPVKSVDDLKQLAAQKAGGLSYGSPGIGTTSHLGCAVLMQTLGIKGTHIPYKGASQVSTALIGDEIDCSMLAAVAVSPHLRNGTIRAIGIAGTQSPPGIEDVPLLTKIDPQVEFDNWQAMFAPRVLDGASVDKLAQAMRKILTTPEVVTIINRDAATPIGLDPAATTKKVNDEIARYKKIVEDFHISLS